MTNPPPNWYPDPAHRFDYRFWDGTEWTDHVARGGVEATDPLPGEPESGAVQSHDAGPEELAGSPTCEPAQEGMGSDVPQHKPGMFARMREEHRVKSAGRDEFESLALRAANGDEEALTELPAGVTEARSLYRPGQLEDKLWDTMSLAIRDVVSDDVLTEDEEKRLQRLADILGTPLLGVQQRDAQLSEELAIARINDGRLPRVINPSILLKRGEEAYGAFDASLMKDQAVREFRGGTSSVSIPLGGGLRYRVGAVRGRSVVVGSEFVVQDSGGLYVTNERVLFTGRTKTLEFRNDRLVGLEQFTDGLRLSVSNRQTASIFRLSTPSMAAAMITASVSKSR